MSDGIETKNAESQPSIRVRLTGSVLPLQLGIPTPHAGQKKFNSRLVVPT